MQCTFGVRTSGSRGWHKLCCVAGSNRTPKARAVGAALQAARNERGLSQRALAARIDRSPGTVARWETGDRAPDPTDVAQILAVLEITGDRYDEIVEMSRGTGEPRWLAISLPEQRQQLNAVLEFERTANKLTEVSPLLIPGVLQSTDYTRAIMSAGGVPADEVETRVAVRIGRRDVITRNSPVPLLALIGEGALRQLVGGREVMAAQLRHLLELTELNNVEVRAVPYDTGWHPGLEGPFTLIDSQGSGYVVHLETRRSGLFLHEPSDVETYRQAVDAVLQVAMNPVETKTHIVEIAQQMEK